MKYNFTFEDLEKDPFEKKIIEILEQKYGHPLADDFKEYLIDNAGNAQLRVDQRVSWVNSAISITQNIIKGVATTAEYPLFWIRLWGIVRELAPYLQNTREIGDFLKWVKPQLEAVDELMAMLTADDLILVDFMRHNHSHMHVDYIIDTCILNATSKAKKGEVQIDGNTSGVLLGNRQVH
jgi:hypothetical protein